MEKYSKYFTDKTPNLKLNKGSSDKAINKAEKENLKKDKLGENLNKLGTAIPALSKHPETVVAEGNKLISQLDPMFIEKLIKIQKDPTIKQILSSNTRPSEVVTEISNSPDQPTLGPTPQYITSQTREKINQSELLNFYKPEELDTSKIKYLDGLVSNLRNDIQKKTIENDNLNETNNKLEKNYDQLHNQLLLYETKHNTITNEITVLNGVKNSFVNYNEKIKEGSNILTEIQDNFKKINSEISSKVESIQKYEEKVQKDLTSFKEEKQKLDKTYGEKHKKLEEVKHSFSQTEKMKKELIESVKNSFEAFAKEEIKFLKLKNEENELEMQIKNEENSEKLLAAEIEHLKSTNIIEIQKIDDLKQEIEKSKNLRDYLKNEIDDLEKKLKSEENETKQSQVEYELKKSELEEKLIRLKEEMKSEDNLNKEEREKYKQIENDIKNKISYVSLQNSSLLGQNSADFIIKKVDSDHDNVNFVSENFSNKENDNFYSFKQREKVDNNDKAKDSENEKEKEEKLKKQVLVLLKHLNENQQ